MLKFLSILLFLCYSLNSVAQQKFTVAIDPGHGGYDAGAIGNGLKEKDIVLAVSIQLGELLSEKGINVVYTRQKDKYIPLHQRAQLAEKSNADLFISVHVNFYTDPSVYGAETFVIGMHQSDRNLEIAKKENSVILIEDNFEANYSGFDPTSSESYIIFDLIQEQYFDQSIILANKMQENFREIAGRRNRGVKQAGFIVLKEASTPSVLIELGYITNPAEALYLSSDKGQQLLAEAISEAILNFRSNFF